MITENFLDIAFEGNKSSVSFDTTSKEDYKPFYSNKVKYDFKKMDIHYVKSAKTKIPLFHIGKRVPDNIYIDKERIIHHQTAELEAYQPSSSLAEEFLAIVTRIALLDTRQKALGNKIKLYHDSQSTETSKYTDIYEKCTTKLGLNMPLQREQLKLYKFLVTNKGNVMKDLRDKKDELGLAITSNVIQYTDGPFQFTINRKEFKYLK